MTEDQYIALTALIETMIVMADGKTGHLSPAQIIMNLTEAHRLLVTEKIQPPSLPDDDL